MALIQKVVAQDEHHVHVCRGGQAQQQLAAKRCVGGLEQRQRLEGAIVVGLGILEGGKGAGAVTGPALARVFEHEGDPAVGAAAIVNEVSRSFTWLPILVAFVLALGGGLVAATRLGAGITEHRLQRCQAQQHVLPTRAVPHQADANEMLRGNH